MKSISAILTFSKTFLKIVNVFVRTLKAAKTSEKEMAVKLEDTTCGIDAFRRGMGQKIVGFSFYGDINSKHSIEKGYFEGIAENLRLLQKYYPGWTMRLYHSFEEKDSVMTKLCDLACNDQNLDLCDAENLPGTPMKDATKVFAMNWRFFPTIDPQVFLTI